MLSDKKNLSHNCITIIGDDIVYTGKKEVAEKLNNFFMNAVDDLEIEPFECVTDAGIFSGNIPEIIKRYQKHPSIVKIKEKVQIKDKFTFKEITSSQIKQKIDKLIPKKACIGNDIPTKVLMGNSDIVCDLLAKIYNKSKDNKDYPTSMKIADVIPVYKPNEKNERVFKKNYRPVSLTYIVSKVFERNMFNEINQYIDKF